MCLVEQSFTVIYISSYLSTLAIASTRLCELVLTEIYAGESDYLSCELDTIEYALTLVEKKRESERIVVLLSLVGLQVWLQVNSGRNLLISFAPSQWHVFPTWSSTPNPGRNWDNWRISFSTSNPAQQCSWSRQNLPIHSESFLRACCECEYFVCLFVFIYSAKW